MKHDINHLASKLEDPKRLEELAPADTLRRIGLREHDVVCDVGAGTGVFTLPAAKITGSTVYAVDISERMRAIIRGKANDDVKVLDNIGAVPDACCDIALLCAVLHEVDDIFGMLTQIRRALKPGARLAVIDFYKAQTPMGPPMEIRLSEEDIIKHAEGFAEKDRFGLSENLYCLILQREA